MKFENGFTSWLRDRLDNGQNASQRPKKKESIRRNLSRDAIGVSGGLVIGILISIVFFDQPLSAQSLVVSLSSGAIGFMYSSHVGFLIRFDEKINAITKKQTINNSITRAAISANSMLYHIVENPNEEIRMAGINSIIDQFNLKQDYNRIRMRSEWMALVLYKNLWAKLCEIQAGLRDSSNSPVVVLVTHCGPIRLLDRSNNHYSHIFRSIHAEFIENGGRIARIIINRGKDSEEKYRNAINEMAEMDIDVFYLRGVDEKIDLIDLEEDFFTAEVPENDLGIEPDYLFTEWRHDHDRGLIQEGIIGAGPESRARHLSRWQFLIGKVLVQAEETGHFP